MVTPTPTVKGRFSPASTDCEPYREWTVTAMPPVTRPLRAALLSFSLASLAPADAAELPSPWNEAPLETLGDGHRVREGHVASAEDLAADAGEAAAGRVIGARAAHAALLRADAARQDGSAGSAPAGASTRSGRDRHTEATWLADVGILLTGDPDGDGYYGAVELSIDVDTEGVSRDVYAAIDLTEPSGGLTVAHTTRTFTVRGHSSNDAYRVEIELLDNHRAAERDVRIEIRDSWSDALLDAVSPRELASLGNLPLESERSPAPIRDAAHAPPAHTDYALGVLLTGSGHGSSSHSSGGYLAGNYASGRYGSSGYSSLGYSSDSYVSGYAGAAGPLVAFVLLGAALARRRPAATACRERHTARRKGKASL